LPTVKPDVEDFSAAYSGGKVTHYDRIRGSFDPLPDVERWCCDTAIARLPEAPPEILERAKVFQRSTRAARNDDPIGPLFGGA